MFRVGDKVVPNGFRVNGDKHCYGTNPEMIELEKESKVVTVEGIDEGNCIHVTDGKRQFTYHPSELRIATEKEKEIEALNETKKQKFDFESNVYVLELKNGKTFIAVLESERGDIWGLSGGSEDDLYAYLNQDAIKKIIAIIPKR